jgi:hypothetical protein
MIEFLAVWAALTGTHDFADHWVQGNADAQHKGEKGWPGRLHCLRHVLTYGATQYAALLVLVLAFGLDLNPLAVLAGAVVNLGTHYFADRRTPLRWVASLIPGKVQYHDNGGQYHLDQSWHKAWIFVAALVTAL